jgi:CBS domain containing-hemolysin-like protein
MGGYVMARLGRVPVVGDEITVPGWRIHVTGMARRRVARLRFVPDPDSAPEPPGPEPDTVAEVPR